jgi:hypothetical protein
MHAGAADYLIKGELTAQILERAIRYTSERRRTMDALAEERALISYSAPFTYQETRQTTLGRHAGRNILLLFHTRRWLTARAAQTVSLDTKSRPIVA